MCTCIHNKIILFWEVLRVCMIRRQVLVLTRSCIVDADKILHDRLNDYDTDDKSSF